MDDQQGPWPREITFIAPRKGISLRSAHVTEPLS